MNWFKDLFRANKQPPPEASASVQAADGPTSFPWPIKVTSGSEALETVFSLRATEKDCIPVVLGDDEDLEGVFEAIEYNSMSVAEIIQVADTIDIQEWLQNRVAEDPDFYTEEVAQPSSDSEPTQTKPLSLAFNVLNGKPKPKVNIALIPTTYPWEVPAHLKLGNWNECPAAEVHVAFFRSWFDRYGAVVTGIGTDTIEFSVARPPQSIEEARLLAHEHFVYCSDIVYQGVQSVDRLARVLVKSDNWFFWWD